MKPTIYLVAFLVLVLTPFVMSLYIDPSDPRYPDQNRYIDQVDPRVNKLQPGLYVDPADSRYIPFSSINQVKPTKGNIDFVPGTSNVRIQNDSVNSRIILFVDVNSGTATAINWVELSAVIPWQDVNVANNITVDWTGLQNYPSGCPIGQAVRVIGDTLTCVVVGDLNQADANGFYVKLNPTTTQQITGRDLNIFTTSTLPPLTINTNNTIMQRWMLNNTVELEVCNIFGFSGICSNTINNPVGFFGFPDLTGYFAVAGGGLASALNDDVSWEFQAPLTKVTGNIFQADNNANIKDLNVINTSNLNKLRVLNDTNFLRNARINDSLYVDKNIYADTYERDLGINLDTCYTNGGKRDMHVYGGILTEVKQDDDVAFVSLQTGTGCGALNTVQVTGIKNFGINPNGVIESFYFPFSFLVHDGNAFKITSTVSGSGTVTLENARGYYP